MKPMVVIGIVLMVLGVLALAYQGFSYTDKEKVVDIGPIEATAETEESVAVPPIIGGMLLVGGIVLTVMGARRRTAYSS